jgi:hypothetical protein
MGIIKQIDNRLMTLITKHHYPEGNVFKPRSFLTIFALIFPYFATNFLEDVSTIFSKLLIIGFLSFGLVCAVMATYEWRYFFLLRKKGLNQDRNYFFEESAGKYRKSAFYFSLIIFILLEVFKVGDIKSIDFKYILRSDFYQLLSLSILRYVVWTIVLVELVRVLFPSAAKWSNKKHLLVVILLLLTFSVLQFITLRILSGHGIF